MELQRYEFGYRADEYYHPTRLCKWNRAQHDVILQPPAQCFEIVLLTEILGDTNTPAMT